MTKDPSRKQSKVFVIITVIQIQVSKWEAVIVCHSRTPRGMRTVTILPQVIRSHFGKWEAAAVWVYRRFGGVQIFQLVRVLTVHQAIPIYWNFEQMGSRTTTRRAVPGAGSRRRVKLLFIYFLPNYCEYNVHYPRATIYIIIYLE